MDPATVTSRPTPAYSSSGVRDDEASLPVELALAGPCEEMALHAASVLTERVERGNPLDQFLPLGTWITARQPSSPRERDDTVCKGCPQLGRAA